MSIRPVKRIVETQPTIEGAGVRLRRAFGFGNTKETDPFLLLDDFRNERPADYVAGFPWHPRRGIETITYVLRLRRAGARGRGVGDVEPAHRGLGNGARTSAAKKGWAVARLPGDLRASAVDGECAARVLPKPAHQVVRRGPL